ncbi:nitroreductase family protein [Breoghania sp.]|uniref:nitroreductase family protein n=1 Tax=Breoghania sp. TaxID=2065378 RepID=UPI002AA80F47|nr:nitroreductase family protein [Breoghania sp.]
MGKLKPEPEAVATLRLAEGVRISDATTQARRLVTPSGEISLRGVDPALACILDELPTVDWSSLPPELQMGLQSIADLGLIEAVFDAPWNGQPSVIVISWPSLARLLGQPAALSSGPVLACDVALLQTGDGAMLFCGRSKTTVHLDQARVARLPRPIGDDAIAEPDSRILRLFQRLGWTAETSDSTSAPEPQDALLHLVSCYPDPQKAYGKRPRPNGPAHPLPHPWTRAPATCLQARRPPVPDVPLAEIFARRRSCRRYRQGGIDMAALSALCSLALSRRPGPDISCPYPSAGGLGETAVYLAFFSQEDPQEARLAVLDQSADHLWAFDDSAAAARDTLSTFNAIAAEPDFPAPCGLILAADYDLMSHSYAAIAYTNILRNAGAIYQTVSLAAEALGLASCAVGGAWGHLETSLRRWLDGRLIVGGMILGAPA